MLDRIVMRFTNLLLSQSADAGALPVLFAATQPDLQSGAYVGPDGPGEFRGRPRVTTPARGARDERAAARLWDVSEELTGVSFRLGNGAAA
jgi:hypothetical protein